MTNLAARLTLLHPLRMVETMSSSIAHTILGVSDASPSTSEWSTEEYLMMALFVGGLIGIYFSALGVVRRLTSSDGVARTGWWRTLLWLVGLGVAVSFSTPRHDRGCAG